MVASFTDVCFFSSPTSITTPGSMFSPTSCRPSVTLMAICRPEPNFGLFFWLWKSLRFSLLSGVATWKLCGLPSLSWMRVFNLALGKFHSQFSPVRSVQAQPSIMLRKSVLFFRCESVKPLGVWDDSGPDFRLIFCTFLVGHRRRLLQLAVCSKTTPTAFPAAAAAAAAT